MEEIVEADEGFPRRYEEVFWYSARFLFDKAENIADAAVRSLVIEAFPTTSVVRTVEDVLSVVRPLRTDPRTSACSGLATDIAGVVRCLQGLHDGQGPTPEVAVLYGPFMKKIVKASEIFLVMADTSTGKPLIGRKALEDMWTTTSRKANGEKPFYDESALTTLRTYEWLLTPEQSRVLQGWAAKFAKQILSNSNRLLTDAKTEIKDGTAPGQLVPFDGLKASESKTLVSKSFSKLFKDSQNEASSSTSSSSKGPCKQKKPSPITKNADVDAMLAMFNFNKPSANSKA